MIVQLSSRRTAKGKALDYGSEQTFSFADCEELAAQLTAINQTAVLLIGVKPSSAAARRFQADWPGDSTGLWFAADLAYLFDLPQPANLREAAKLWSAASELLQAIADDLLAQFCLLVQEQALNYRLGFFLAELYRRHDPLSIPAAGEVDLARFFPLGGEREKLTRQDVAPDMLENVFTARESLQQAFERFEDRPQQVEMAQAVEQALAESRPLIVEAGTGVGKSLAYLLPLAIYSAQTGNLCIVSTNTLNLQQQLVEHDIPRLRQILDVLDLKITLLKGREHYLCLKRLNDTWFSVRPTNRQRIFDRGLMNEDALLLLFRLVRQHDNQPGIDFSSVPSPPDMRQQTRGRLLRSLDCRFQTCLGDRCEYKAQCRFFAQRAEASASNIVITNHALVFSLYNPMDADTDNIVTRSSAIVFDEAHNLEGVITNQNTLELSHATPVDLGNRLLAVLENDAIRKRLVLDPHGISETWREHFLQIRQLAGELPDLIKLSVEIREQVNRLIMQAADKGHLWLSATSQLTPPTATTGQRQVLDLLAKLAARMHAVIDRWRLLASALREVFVNQESDLFIDDDYFQMELQSLSIDILEASLALSNWRPEDTEAITWFNCAEQDGEPAWDYKTAPLDIGPIFQGLLNNTECVVMCSATLTVSGRFDYLQESLGFDPATVGHAQWLKLESPFDYQRQARLLVATDLVPPTGPSRDEYLVQLEQVVHGVCQIFPRGILVLFNSYRDLNHIAERLGFHDHDERLLIQGVSGTRAEIADLFRKSGDKVLLATRSFWEGFDVAGEALSCVVLAKLPFANFKDPIHAGRQRAIDAEGGDSFKRYSLPLAAMQLKQGFGRLIRTQSDRGCVFLLDSRVAHANYGKVFLESLPNPATFTGGYQECLEQARRFMENNTGEQAHAEKGEQ